MYNHYVTISDTDVGYIAGFWEGEGYAGVWYSTRMGRLLKAEGRSRIDITQKDPTALYYIQGLVGGTVRQRSDSGPDGCYHLFITRDAEVVRFIRLVYPHIRSRRKRKQLRLAYRNSRAREAAYVTA